jgi:hypothetical protein
VQQEKPQSASLQAGNKKLVVFLKSLYLQQECAENEVTKPIKKQKL